MNPDNITNLNDKKFVFVIEDSDDFQLLLTQLLEDDGYLVECASNGLEALEKLKAMRALPDLILLDLMMPIMDGYEFQTRLARESTLAQIPIVLMTAHGDIQASKAKIGARDAIRKPIDMIQMLTVVKAQAR